MTKRGRSSGRYRSSMMAKMAALLLVVLLAWAAWEFGVFDAIGALSTVPVPAPAQG